MISVPDWVPAQIAPIFRTFERLPFTEREIVIATRLATDERMRTVWEELLRKNKQTGEYFHSARPNPTSSARTRDEAQFFAVQDIIRVAVSATRDNRSVTRRDEIEKAEQHLKGQSYQLRILAQDMQLAIEMGQLGIVDDPSKMIAAEHLAALCHVANWLDHLASALRKSDDPLMVQRVRGDPVVKGVQIDLAGVSLQHFGLRLDGTMATIASVAVGSHAKRRSARSALSGKNRA